MTINGEERLDFLSPNDQLLFRSGQLVVLDEASAGDNRCLVFAPYAHVKRYKESGLFRIVEFKPAGTLAHGVQGMYLLQKP